MIKNLLSEIESDVVDIKTKKFDYVKTQTVPNRYDTALTFERGENKIGKELETCVLFVDIRNSVALNKKHTTQTMGRIYSIFTKSILKAAKYHNGHIRNIIGDRVMIVFDPNNCFTNSIECAYTINNISNIINSKFTEVDFKCGIGIDYGNLKVLKIGLHRRGTEVVENRNLVWVGYPANIASRLTDNANKMLFTRKFNVTYKSTIDLSFLSSSPTFSPFKSGVFSNEITDNLSQDQFCQNISFESGKIKYTKGEFISFTKIPSLKSFKKILITKSVFLGYKKENSNHKSIKENWWKINRNHGIKDVNEEIYESSIQWTI
ncbi:MULTISPECIES: adenylate/guanylate cyclase domain-containing protein [Flavobacterium]|uniref:adenylate/guanylate cyclase domain-containing protein n=1 Tax=Flavobacterium TaxID=237 RepID=UPI002114BC42|nr:MULTISPECIES: adenylate/guanylate cyclase domain-containing protein [Flavobacterium]UUF12359.1 adenylate/guanylate cyclase domain-containing protein [Flavobacterium panici]